MLSTRSIGSHLATGGVHTEKDNSNETLLVITEQDGVAPLYIKISAINAVFTGETAGFINLLYELLRHKYGYAPAVFTNGIDFTIKHEQQLPLQEQRKLIENILNSLLADMPDLFMHSAVDWSIYEKGATLLAPNSPCSAPGGRTVYNRQITAKQLLSGEFVELVNNPGTKWKTAKPENNTGSSGNSNQIALWQPFNEEIIVDINLSDIKQVANLCRRVHTRLTVINTIDTTHVAKTGKENLHVSFNILR